MAALAFHRPETIADAVKLAHDPEAKIIAGGQSLLPSVRLGLIAPSAFVDLAGVRDLQGIRVEGKNLVIGAMTTHAAVEASPDVERTIPALARLAGLIGDAQVRNRGTIGGSLANSDPAADYPAAVLALGAIVQTNKRRVAADDYFKGLFETALESDELIVAVSFPVPERAGYMKFSQPASRFALAGVFVATTAGGVRVAVTGAGLCAFRVGPLEDGLTKRFAPESCENVRVPAKGLNSDIHGSAEYRAHLIPELARRAVTLAVA